MRRAAPLLAALVGLSGAPVGADEGPRTQGLEGLPTGATLRLADVDGDGLTDLLALAGRELVGWAGVRDALPAASPRWRLALPAEVSAVDVARERRPALIGLAQEAALRLPLDGGEAERLEGSRGLGWRDRGRAIFVDLHPAPAGAAFVVPAARGWALLSGLGTPPRVLDLDVRRVPTAAGAFLEDSAQVSVGLPRVTSPRPRRDGAAATAALWALAGERLLRLEAERRDAYDLSFLPAQGERSLLDLDGDGVPEVLHRDGENRETRYAYFRLPAPKAGETAPGAGEIAPPFSFLKLSGFNLDPAYVDLDGDGRLDLVVTTIEIDAQNTLRAVASGKVTAVTRAYVQRRGADDRPAYPGQPDAAVTSDIGVRIRFGYTGNLDVTRSFTIVADTDLDGDGRRDLLIRAGHDALLWRRGRAEGVWEAEPRRLAFPALAPGEELEAHAAELDGDGRGELVLHVRGAAGGRDRLLVLDVP